MDTVDYADAFELALEDLIQDLHSIMKKDICKKMVTQSAFKFFENWWAVEERKSKVSHKCCFSCWELISAVTYGKKSKIFCSYV